MEKFLKILLSARQLYYFRVLVIYGKVLLYVAIFLSELEKNIKQVVKSPLHLATTCRTSKKFLKTSKFWSETFQL